MNQLPKLSIITPSFNQAQFLEDCIQSVLSQKYPNLEYIIIDGGSTDGSLEIIEKYQDQLAYWESVPDNGQADAINKGFQRATGEYIAWLNSDDVYLPGTFEKAIRFLQQQQNLGMVYGNLRSIDAQGRHFHTITYKQYSLEDLLAFRIIGQPSVFMRREVLEQAGHLDLDYHFILDHHLWIRMASIAPFKYISEDWAAARHHEEAKNTARAEFFGIEAYRLLAWAKTEPHLAKIIKNNPRKVWGGAYRFDARYLLDGEKYWPAHKSYIKAFLHSPRFALREGNRIVFSFFALFGFGFLRKSLMKKSSGQLFIRSIPKTPILVTGSHRSGSTWVGRILSSPKTHTYISEPLNSFHLPGILQNEVVHWYTYICEENENEYLFPFQKMLQWRYFLKKAIFSSRSIKELGKAIINWYSFLGGGLFRKNAILKDPFAVFSAPWFSKRLGCQVVITIRHPAAFVSSLMRLGWEFDFSDLLDQPLLMRDWLEPFEEEMKNMPKGKEFLLEQACLLWRVIYYVVNQYQITDHDYIFIKHETLSSNPVSEFKSIFNQLGLPFTKKIEVQIYQSTNPSNPSELDVQSPHNIKIDSKKNIKNWQTRLSKEEIQRVRELTADIANLYYSAEDWNK